MTQETKAVATQEEKPPVQVIRIEDLYNNDQLQVKIHEAQFTYIVNQEPKKEWLKNHPIAKKEIEWVDDKGVLQKKTVPAQFIPIERVEWLLDNVIGKYRKEIKSVQQVANSVVVTVRLHYWHPVWQEWTFHDGVGAAPLQTNSGAGAIDWNQIKSNAVQIGAPAAESYAIKDAAEHIGKLFGRDANRKESMVYDGFVDRYANALKVDEESKEEQK